MPHRFCMMVCWRCAAVVEPGGVGTNNCTHTDAAVCAQTPSPWLGLGAVLCSDSIVAQQGCSAAPGGAIGHSVYDVVVWGLRCSEPSWACGSEPPANMRMYGQQAAFLGMSRWTPAVDQADSSS
jgi:hypothetical protein